MLSSFQNFGVLYFECNRWFDVNLCLKWSEQILRRLHHPRILTSLLLASLTSVVCRFGNINLSMLWWLRSQFLLSTLQFLKFRDLVFECNGCSDVTFCLKWSERILITFDNTFSQQA